MTSSTAFIAESNRIEGIRRPPSQTEVRAHNVLWGKPEITVSDLRAFVRDVAGQPIRHFPGQDVRVGRHVPPPGGQGIEIAVETLLAAIHEGLLSPYEAHRQYELLHPFMDGNGRSGRALWAWHMTRVGEDPFALPFLHRWYYQSLDAAVAR